jgi:DNA-binding GntR family transcriptional regulator
MPDYVRRLSAEDILSIYVMRELLEGYLLDNIRPFTSDELQQLIKIKEQMAESVDTNIQRFQELNMKFHFAIFRNAHYPFIISELKRLWLLSEPYRLMWATDGSRRHQALKSHEDFISALSSNNLQALRQIADEHRRGQGSPITLIPYLFGNGEDVEEESDSDDIYDTM